MATDPDDIDLRKLYSKEFLYHYDLDGRDVTLTISRVKAGELTDVKNDKKVKKPVLYFQELEDRGIDKGYAVPITVLKIIAGMYGSFKSKALIGKRITLYPTTCQSFGQTVECIRVRPRIPKEKGKAATVPVDPVEGEPVGTHEDDASEASA